MAVGFLIGAVLCLLGFLGRGEALLRRPPVGLRDAVAVGSGGVVAVASFGVVIALWWEGGFGPWVNVFVLLTLAAMTIGVLAENDRSDWLTLMNRFRRRRR